MVFGLLIVVSFYLQKFSPGPIMQLKLRIKDEVRKRTGRGKLKGESMYS